MFWFAVDKISNHCKVEFEKKITFKGMLFRLSSKDGTLAQNPLFYSLTFKSSHDMSHYVTN